VTVDDIDAWLASLGVTLWADWFVNEPDRRRLAAQWFADEALKCLHWFNAQPKPLPPPKIEEYWTMGAHDPPPIELCWFEQREAYGVVERQLKAAGLFS
jgi:hypothetical protein